MGNLLSQPCQINRLRLKNPLVVAPMALCVVGLRDGLVTEDRLEHYRALAKGGFGLIIVEACQIRPYYLENRILLGIWSDDHIAGLGRIVDACHEHGAKVVIQINYRGLNEQDNTHQVPELSLPELKQVQQDFIAATLRAEKAGADGVELHAAHNFFLSQILSPLTNKRREIGGDTLEGRAAYVIDILKEVKSRCRQDFIMGIRMGYSEPDMETSIRLAKMFEQAGFDYLHISTGVELDSQENYTEQESISGESFPYSDRVYGASQIKPHVKIPVIAVDGIKTGEQALEILEQNYGDLVAIGRGALADYDWANKVISGENPNICLSCLPCKWFTDRKKCPARRSAE